MGQLLVAEHPGSPPAALLDHPNFAIRSLRESAAANDAKWAFPGFLRSQAYNARAFVMVQLLWNSEVGETMLDDPHFSSYMSSQRRVQRAAEPVPVSA